MRVEVGLACVGALEDGLVGLAASASEWRPSLLGARVALELAAGPVLRKRLAAWCGKRRRARVQLQLRLRLRLRLRSQSRSSAKRETQARRRASKQQT